MEKIIENVVNPASLSILAIAVIALYVAYQKQKIDKSAIISTGVVGLLCLSAGGWKWAMPLVMFFVVGNIASHYKKQLKEYREVAQDPRTCLNVVANGGAATLFSVFYITARFTGDNPIHCQLYFLGLMAAMATAAADTLGTEIGQTSKGKPRSIITWKRVKVGTAGAVSTKGLMSFLLGSTIISGLLLVWGYPITIFGICVISGFLGAVLDSVFGSTLEQWKWKFLRHYDTNINNLITTLTAGIIAMTLATIL